LFFILLIFIILLR